MRTPFAVMAVLLVALLALGFLTEDDDGEPAAAPAAAPVDVIAKRVEALRRLRFDELPEPVEVTAEQARSEGLESLDRDYPAERLRDDETVYELLGLIEPGADLRELTGNLFGEGVAGYYDPRDGRLRVVEGAGTGTRVLEEMILAHELTHALEDQRFGLESDAGHRRQHAGALGALRGERHRAHVRVRGRALQRRGDARRPALLGFEDTGDLPPFIQAQVLFAYVGGEAFVRGLLERGGWGLVDTAFEVPAVARPSRSCTRTPTSRPTSPSRSGSAPCSPAGSARTPAPGASCRRASCWRRVARGRGRLGRRPLRAVAARRRRRADHALALGHAARRGRVRGPAARGGRRPRRRGRAAAAR